MKDKNGNKRKLSFRYICLLVACPLFFVIFFLVSVFYFRIFEKFETAKVISVYGTNTDKDLVTFLVDGEEFTTYYHQPVSSHLSRQVIRTGDKIQYLIKDPNFIMPGRTVGIVGTSIAEGGIIVMLISATICEVKKGM